MDPERLREKERSDRIAQEEKEALAIVKNLQNAFNSGHAIYIPIEKLRKIMQIMES